MYRRLQTLLKPSIRLFQLIVAFLCQDGYSREDEEITDKILDTILNESQAEKRFR